MAKNKTITITSIKVDNKTDTIVNKVVEAVVVDNKLVADIREINPGVICR